MKLERFQMGHVGTDKVLVFFGKPKSGITTMILDYLDYNLDLPVGMVFPGISRESYENKVPSVFLHSDYRDNLLKEFVKYQTKRSKLAIDDLKRDPRSFLIFDSTLTNEIQKNTDFNTLLKLHARLNTTIILGVDHPEELQEEVLNSASYLFVFGYENLSYLKRVHRLINKRHPRLDYETFMGCVKYLANNYSCLVIDNSKTFEKLEEKIYWYHADVDRLRHFRICDPKYWILQAGDKNIKIT